MIGRIIDIDDSDGPNPSSYTIQYVDSNGDTQTVIAHVGDIFQNERLLFSLEPGKLPPQVPENLVTQILQREDEVIFDLFKEPHAIHVRRSTDST